MATASDTDVPAEAARTIADIKVLLASQMSDPKRLDELQAIYKASAPETTDKKDLARYYRKKAEAAEELADERGALAAMEQVVSLGGAADLNNDLEYLSSLQERVSNISGAIDTTLRRIEMANREANSCMYRRLVNLYAQIDIVEAERAQSISEGQYQLNTDGAKWHKSGKKSKNHEFGLKINTQTGCFEGGRASVLEARGKRLEAEAAFRKSIDELERGYGSVEILAYKHRSRNYLPEETQRLIEQTSSRLALLLADQGRLFDAEIMQRDLLKRSVERRGGNTSVVAGILNNLATVLTQQGRFSEAEQLSRFSLEILTTIQAPADSKLGVETRQSLAQTLLVQGRYAEALAQHEILRQGFATAPPVLQRLANGGVNYALAAIKVGAPEAALKALDDLIPRSQNMLGTDHIDTVELRGAHAMALAAVGRQSAALEEFRALQKALIAATLSQGDEPSPVRNLRLRLILESYLELLADVDASAQGKSIGIDAAGEAFRLVDVLRSQSTQAAVMASAVRAAANDSQIGGEIRKEQDLAQELVALHRILRELMMAPANQQLPKVMADMQERIGSIKKERISLQKNLEQRFPAYANLIRPQPPSLSETRAILHGDEALINIFTTDTATYVWAFRKDGLLAFARVKLRGGELARRVQVLRTALDPGDVDLFKEIPDFDLDTAYRIFADLLTPVAAGWQGANQILVTANGALSQLPLALLPTAKVNAKPDSKITYGQYKDVPWFALQSGFTYLPSVNTLVTLRRLPAVSAQRSAFIGFGDPQFAITPIEVASNTRRLRSLGISRPSLRAVEQAKPVEWLDYARIPLLPDTRDEILALAKALKADPDKDVFLGSHASTVNVKKIDLSGRRVLAFATHGLLPNDFPGISEPSLALANPGGGKHGLLTLEDILGLKLNADLVVLSACNTAAGDGQGADALSGLGRGFLYAGTRALLVTHWPVESESARLLVTGLFERQATDAKLSRAQALRQSMLALMQRTNSSEGFAYAHPLFWAPYVLIGEGGM